jgi:hypothetical protein
VSSARASLSSIAVLLLTGLCGCTALPTQGSVKDAAADDAAGGSPESSPGRSGPSAGVQGPQASLDGPPAAADRGGPGPTVGADASGAGADAGTTAMVAADMAPLAPDGPRPLADAALLAVGQRCRTSGECDGAHCVDGVCCSTACTAKCTSCAAADTGQPDGTCAPSRAGADPRNECAPGAQACGDDGTCDGKGQCRLAQSDVACGSESCTSGMYTGPGHCNGRGSCEVPAPVSCGSYPCQSGGCAGACSASAPCIEGFFCDAGKCTPRKASGQECRTADECATGNCVEGVCCESACGSKCHSCLAVNTGAASGKCAPVKSGTDPLSHCSADPASSCRQDGFCDGNGACRLHAAGTPCRPDQCVDSASGSTHLAAGTCNGAGACSDPGAGESCLTYVCGAAICKKTCSAETDCIASAYCGGNQCLAKKGLGSLCAAGKECGSGVCGGRCCATACNCQQPSPGNKLKNPGFDRDLADWRLELAKYIDFESFNDGTGCDQYSGSMRLSISASRPDDSGAMASQCASVTPGTTYYFGGRLKASETPGASVDWNATCKVVFYTVEDDCTKDNFPARLGGQQITVHDLVVQPATWYEFEGSATAPAGGNFARYECSAIDDTGHVVFVYLDTLYLSTASKGF